jgi:hypothetical protein
MSRSVRKKGSAPSPPTCCSGTRLASSVTRSENRRAYLNGPPTFYNAGVNRMGPKKKPRCTTRGWNNGAGTEKRKVDTNPWAKFVKLGKGAKDGKMIGSLPSVTMASATYKPSCFSYKRNTEPLRASLGNTELKCWMTEDLRRSQHRPGILWHDACYRKWRLPHIREASSGVGSPMAPLPCGDQVSMRATPVIFPLSISCLIQESP